MKDQQQPKPKRMHALVKLTVVVGIVASFFGLQASALAFPVQQSTALSAATAAAIPAKLTCAVLAQQDFSTIPGAPTVILTTQVVSATAQNPEYCDVKGYIAPQIQFEMRLPTTSWNGRYLQSGCGGFCGVLVASADCNVALGRNFAVAFDDEGHVGKSPLDATWAANDQQLRIDFGYRSEHVLALSAKAIITIFYGVGPHASYFDGCSDGGREALNEAQRYPDDFNGIIAGAPAAIWAPLNAEFQTWDSDAVQDAQGHLILTPDKLPLIHNAVLANCDGKDGLVDGQIDDPRACTFNPSSLECKGGGTGANCLSAAQVQAVKKIYEGPVDAKGEHLYPGGEPYGSELAWEGWMIPPPGVNLNSLPSESIANGYLKYQAYPIPQNPPPSYSYRDFQFTVQAFNQTRTMGELYNATNPNLTAFRKHGGKLILWHGWADQAIPPFGTLAYYQAMRDYFGRLTNVQQFARLFMFPTVYHCGGGYGPDQFDLLTPIVSWVEQGVAPSKIIAAQVNSGGQVVRTRPVFPYPMKAVYIGSGSINDANNFKGVLPSPLPNDHFNWVGNDLFQPR